MPQVMVTVTVALDEHGPLVMVQVRIEGPGGRFCATAFGALAEGEKVTPGGPVQVPVPEAGAAFPPKGAL